MPAMGGYGGDDANGDASGGGDANGDASGGGDDSGGGGGGTGDASGGGASQPLLLVTVSNGASSRLLL